LEERRRAGRIGRRGRAARRSGVAAEAALVLAPCRRGGAVVVVAADSGLGDGQADVEVIGDEDDD